MVNGEAGRFCAAVLAGIVVSPEYFGLGQFDCRPRAFDHVFKADD